MASSLQAVGAYFLRQAEHALSDDVLLDLRRARVDGAGARPQERGGEGAWLAGRGIDLLELLARDHELAEGAEDLDRQLVVALLELGVRELCDRRRGPRRVALLERREDAERGVTLHLQVGVDPSQLRAHGRILDQRTAAAPELLRGPHELVEGDGVPGHTPERVRAPLVAERGLRDLPALVEAADEIRLLGARVGHEDLGEERAAGDLLERPHLDTGLAHVEKDARDAPVLGHLRIGAAEQDTPVGDGPARRPDLLAVAQEVVALVFGPRLEARQI